MLESAKNAVLEAPRLLPDVPVLVNDCLWEGEILNRAASGENPEHKTLYEVLHGQAEPTL